jgi:AcrR family transcriptional regulator
VRGTARERLLASAARVFAARGYAGASLEDIARDAGVTKGAVYWNFDSKEDLFLALLDERLDQGARRLMELTAGASTEGESAPAVSVGLSEIIDAQRDTILLLHEHWLLAARDRTLAKAYVKRERMLRDAIAATLEARHATLGVPMAVPAERVATMILAVANGMAMDRLIDPEAVPADLFGEALSLFYDGLVRRAQGPG